MQALLTLEDAMDGKEGSHVRPCVIISMPAHEDRAETCVFGLQELHEGHVR